MVKKQGSRILILNAAAASIQDSYEAHETIASRLNIPLEDVHNAMAAGHIFSLTNEEETPTLGQLMEHLISIESVEQRKLSALVHEEAYRIYILVQLENCHHELLMAFYGLVSAYSQAFPNILCMQISEESVPAFEVISEIDMATFLDEYNIAPQFHTLSAREKV